MNAGELLTNTLSPDANVRQDAEQKLEVAARESYPSYMMMLAAELASEAALPHIRAAAGVAVKNALSARDAARATEYAGRWLALDDAAKQDVKSKSLQTLTTENSQASTQAGQVIAAIAAIEIPQGGWKDLIAQLLAASQNQGNAKLRQAALQAIGFTCESLQSTDSLRDQSNEILTAVIQGARKEEPVPQVQLAALQALLNSLVFVRANFEREGERNYIMQVICEATQNQDSNIKVAAYECLVKIMSLYYDKMRFYMEQALFGLTVLGMRDPNQQVALQAVEFWSTVCEVEIGLTLEAEEASEYGEEPSSICFQFARIASSEILPVLLDLLKQQEEDADEDEWDVSKAAGVCVGLLAQCVGDPIVPIAIPFIEGNIKNQDWRSRDAAVMCFGSILDGPDAKTLAPLVEQALPSIIEMLRDTSVPVKDTAAWTLGRISDLLVNTIDGERVLPSLVQALLAALHDQPRIATNCCWAIMNLCEQMGGPAQPIAENVDLAPTSPISPFYEAIISNLLQATQRDGNESNSRTSAYEALATAANNAAKDCLPHVSNLLVAVLERQEQLNGMAAQLVGMDDRNNWAELQSNLCSVIQAIVRTLQKEIMPIADRIMTSLLTLIQNGTKLPTALEDAFLAVAAVISALEADFSKYLDAFLPFMVQSLQSHEEYQLCSISVGLIGDICRALGKGSAPYCETFVKVLFENLSSPTLNRSVKPPILSCFGDIAIAIGAQFEPYLATTMTGLGQAALMQAPNPEDYDLIDYINSLREGIAEAYVGIVSGLRSDNRVDLLQPYVESTFGFVKIVNDTPFERSESLLRGAIGLLGDLASAFPNGQLKDAFRQMWVPELVKAGRAKGNGSETRKISAWAREQITRAVTASG
ncbi:putative karyopherin beta-1 subunit [Tilletiaria anomala UBC 951]|uniref:Importin-95 n=1 Tax=Tilletiaria anomala (strain ATCC 24038 / CBS 436.72 / UBC 951) TaxID=1037660 RepID=A0A066WM07_TILAU|nr:putative karyopherin beta-1 subunit [Tilletiaria anomala UBC 951]KDN53633.1 putative karyopherin beta-1 subunit [Tilletiaria anomala UBC 951]